MWIRFWKIFLSCGLLLLVFIVFSLCLQLEIPASTGPYAVGRMIFHWADSSRPEDMTVDPDDSREIMAFLWYPAEPGTGVDAGYVPDISTLSDTLAQSEELAWWQVLGLRFVRTESSLDATPLKDKASYPVILFSPGNATNVEFYSTLAGEIASHGYVVVGINHPYDVPAVALSDGSVAPYDKAQWSLDAETHQVYTRERMTVRIADLLFALNQVENLGAGAESPFAGLLDLDAVAVAGHSLGGVAASEACKADPRFKACLNLDGLQKGGPFSMEETAIPPSQPFLFVTKESQLHPRQLQSFELTSKSYWVVVHGASHDSFTDGPIVQPALLPVSNRADRLMSSIQQCILAFLDQILRGIPARLLSENVEGEDVSVRAFSSG